MGLGEIFRGPPPLVDGTWENLRKYEEICGKHEEICEKYEENMEEYDGTCGKYEWNMKKYVENMKKYLENMKEHSLPYRLWHFEKFRNLSLNIGFGT